MLDFAKNKKTYAAVAVGLVIGVINALDSNGVTAIHIPGWFNWIIGFCGLGALRAGVQNSAQQTTNDIANLFMLVRGQLDPSPAVIKVQQVAQTPAYNSASETEKTDLLNESQLKK